MISHAYSFNYPDKDGLGTKSGVLVFLCSESTVMMSSPCFERAGLMVTGEQSRSF